MSAGPLDHIESPYERDDIADGLRYCYDKHGKIRKSLIDNDPEIPFSFNPVQTNFRSIDDAREFIGVPRLNDNRGRKQITIPEVEAADESGKYVYVLELTRSDDGQMFLYVGSVSGEKSALYHRISNHRTKGGDFSAPVDEDGIEKMRPTSADSRDGAYSYEGVMGVYPVEKGDICHLREVERRMHGYLCAMFAPYVLGGH